MIIESPSSGTDWKGILLGFALGLVGALLAEWWREGVRKRRLIRALRAEIKRLRSIAVAVAWEFAVAHRGVTAAIASRTLQVIEADPARAAQLGEPMRDELRSIAADPTRLEAFNRGAIARHVIAPAVLPTPVFASQNEVLGYLNEDAAGAVLNVYVAVPGINALSDGVQSMALETPADPLSRAAARFSAQLEQDQESLRQLYEIFVADCDRVLVLLRSRGD